MHKKEAAPKGGFQFISSFKPFGLELHAATNIDEVQILVADRGVIIIFMVIISCIELKRGRVDFLHERNRVRVKLIISPSS